MTCLSPLKPSSLLLALLLFAASFPIRAKDSEAIGKTDVETDCLVLADEYTAAEKDSARQLYAKVLEILAKPEPAMTFNFLVIDAFADLTKKSVEQLALIESVSCIEKHHLRQTSPEVIAEMKHNLLFAFVKSTGERSVSVAKQKHAATRLGAEKVAAFEKLGL